MGKKKRTPQREAALAARKAAARHRQEQNDRERLFALSPGGSIKQPLAVESVSVIEGRARRLPCPLCEGTQRVEDHQVERAADSTNIRRVELCCSRCHSRRKAWFRVALPVPN